jgi:DNA-binding SARP family transcriptional activator
VPVGRGDVDRTIALQLLGGFALRRHGTPVTLNGPGQQLVAFVALGRTRRTGLTRALFPDSDDVHAMGRFRTTLWRVGTACPGLLVVSGPCVSLGEEVELDVARLTSWAVHVTDGFVGDVRFMTPDNWDLLPDVDEDWVSGERERLRELRFHALIEAADLLRSRGRLGAAMQACLGCVAEEPLRESGQRAAIAVHLAEGDVEAAYRRYRRFAELLRRELGVRPSGALVGLLEASGLRLDAHAHRFPSAPRAACVTPR